MAGLLLTATVEDEMTKVLFQIAQRMGKGKDLMSAVGQSLVSSTIRRFSTQTAPDGSPWAALSKATLKKRGPSAKALLASGRLRLSMTFAATSNQVEVGTNLIYARIQFLGGTIKQPERTTTIYRSTKDLARGKSRFVKKSKSDFATEHKVGAHAITIPGRQALGVSAADERTINALVHKFVMGG
jgi:phage virion morphogenesis protein